jgi:hypothetical protein
LAGLCQASWHGFCIGHLQLIPSIAKHRFDVITAQKLTKQPADFIFSAYNSIENIVEVTMCIASLWCVSAHLGQGTFLLTVFTLGHAVEYHCAARLKLFVQFCDMDDAKWHTYGTSPLVHRFLCNVHTWYWTHILRHRRCFGFTSPFWDTTFGTNPMACRLLSYYYAPAPRFLQSCPLPFVDFLLNDYHAEGVVVRGLWANYLHESNLLERTARELRWPGERVCQGI